MPTREEVERITTKFMQSNRAAGNNASREQVREEVVRHAKRIDKKTKKQ
jgi:hypothetical protein|tara:strand:- start:35 stop:181 length:147 start_codon:yes stop_codon:yes gene_type:complete